MKAALPTNSNPEVIIAVQGQIRVGAQVATVKGGNGSTGDEMIYLAEYDEPHDAKLTRRVFYAVFAFWFLIVLWALS